MKKLTLKVIQKAVTTPTEMTSEYPVSEVFQVFHNGSFSIHSPFRSSRTRILEPTDIDFLEEVLTLSVSITAVNSKPMIDVKAFISW